MNRNLEYRIRQMTYRPMGKVKDPVSGLKEVDGIIAKQMKIVLSELGYADKEEKDDGKS